MAKEKMRDPIVEKQVRDFVDQVLVNIEAILRKKHWVMNDLAKMSGISPSTLSDMSSHKTVPDIKTLVQISNLADTSMSRLCATNNLEELDAKKQELLDEFDRLTPVQQDKLLDFIKHAM